MIPGTPDGGNKVICGYTGHLWVYRSFVGIPLTLTFLFFFFFSGGGGGAH